ncbi:MAG: TonB-dependent receptor plug domain-containing protein [Crocinitomix sp.]|nr:TonB-dependent receptor plug domain-containing protein [Crocinitomix sp.]
MKRLLILCLFTLLINHGFAQIIISGTVIGTNNTPLAGATVMLAGSFDGDITDNEGQFKIATELTGEQTLIVKFIGFNTIETQLTLAQSDIELTYVLKESFNELNAVTINAGAFEAGDKKKAVHLNSIDMITVPGAQGNVVGAMQYLPGTTTNGESGKLFVRGGNSRESQTYIDGSIVPVAYNPSAPNTAVRSKFNPFMFDGTVFSTGGFSAEYGQALSSVLLLETKGIQEQDQLDISILTVGLGLAGTKRWEKTAITASFDHTNLYPYLQIVPQNIDWIKTPIANNAGLNFRHQTKNGLFKVYGSYNDSYFELNRNDLDNNNVSTRYKLRNNNYYLNTSWKGTLGKKWLMKASGSYTNNNDQIGINTDKFKESLVLGHLKTVLSRKFNKQIKLKLGTESLLKSYHQSYLSNDEDLNFKFEDATFAAFAESNIYFSKKLVARVGGRVEYSTHLNKMNLSPRISMAYQTSKNSQVSLAAGTFFQQGKNAHLIYTDQLDYEKANQYMINYQWSKNKRTLRGELYVKNYKDLVKFSEAPFYLPEHYTNNGNGYARGFDLFFRDKKTIRNGDYWVSYSFLDTKRNELNYTTEAIPSYASKHNLSFVYKHWIRKWRSLVGCSFNYSSPRFYNDPNKGEFNSEKMKAYNSLNLNWTFLYRENVIFYASASNVLGYEQEFGYEFASTPNVEGVYEKRIIQPPAPRFFVLGCFITLSKSGDKNQLDQLN